MESLLLEKCFFTEKDDKINGSSQRDPLGLQPIWSYYGRNVINHLTTISTKIHGFREVLLCLSICEDINKEKITFSSKDLILYFEQLFIYTAISLSKKKNQNLEIIGSDNGNVRLKDYNDNPVITIDSTILVREISLGYYGRYKTPLSTMKLIDSKSLVKVNKSKIRSLYGDSRYDELLNEFENFLSSEKKHFDDFKAQNALYEAIFGKFRPGEESFWVNSLYVKSNEKSKLMEDCYQKVNTNTDIKEFFISMNNDENISNVVKLEQYLLCLEEVFYKAMKANSIDKVEIADIEEHKKRYDEFCKLEVITQSTLLYNRMKTLQTKCSPYSQNYLQEIINYHKEVCKQKKSSTWIEMDDFGRFQAFVNVDNVKVDLENWGRDYYLDSLKSIKKEIEDFANE